MEDENILIKELLENQNTLIDEYSKLGEKITQTNKIINDYCMKKKFVRSKGSKAKGE